MFDIFIIYNKITICVSCLPQGHLLPDDLLQEEASTQEDPRGHLLLMATSYGVLEQGVGRRT